MKIVRLKNRLDKGTKDILMNLLYRGEMLVEMQLAINVDKSRFLDCSTKFNHYIYELQRAKFGPISELCSIWINKDSRSKFYLDKFKDKNKRSSQPSTSKSIACLSHEGEPITLPFKCSLCQYYYQDCNNMI